MVIGVGGLANKHGGMCFSVDTTEGGYCHIYETDTGAGDLAISGHYVKWLSSAEWASTTYSDT